MHIHIIIDHPWDKSFNHAVLTAFTDGISKNNHTYDILDLNKEAFNPIISEEELAIYSSGGYLDPKIKQYQDYLMAADQLVLIFPIWWNVMPARLKGWMDKVLLPGFAFTTDQIPAPLLTHIQQASIFTTTGSPDDYHRKEYNNALEWVLCKGTLEFCGIKQVKWFNFGETGFAPRKKHEEWIDFVLDYSGSL